VSGNGNEVQIRGLADVGTALQLMAKRLRMSVTALVATGGTENGTLVGIGTGATKAKDMAVGPLFRVLQAVNWEMAGRTQDPHGIVIRPEGALEMLVCGADGGRLDVSVGSLDELPRLLNTMAAANGLTITALNKAAKLGGGSLIGMAKGTTPQADIRLNGLVQMTYAAQFELLIRPVHATRRAARSALAATRRG
jgi:hypothetical protein